MTGKRICEKVLVSFLSIGYLLAMEVQAGGDKNPAATPSPRMGKDKNPDANWMKRHEGFVAIAKKGNADVLFLGDSITDGWRNNGKAAWKKYFEPLKAVNFGIGGDRTEHVLWRIQNGELEGIQPKVAVIMIGTNNTSAGHSAEHIAEGNAAIIKTLQQKFPSIKILLLAVFPRANLKTGEMSPKIEPINNLIKKFDDGKNVKYLDIGQKFLVDGKMSKDIMYDYLHLTAQGYEIWGAAIAPVVREMLGSK